MCPDVEENFMLKKPSICKGNIVKLFTAVVIILKRHEQRHYKKLFFSMDSRVQSPTGTICLKRHLKKKMAVQTPRSGMFRLYETKPLQNAFKRISHYIYLFKLYSISIILLLKNNQHL